MPDTTSTTVLVVAVACVIAMIAVLLMIWKMLRVVENLSGSNRRALNRERELYLKHIERFVEKKQAGSHMALDMANRHREERMVEVHADVEIEKAAVQNNNNVPKPTYRRSNRNKPMTDKQILGMRK